MILDCNRKSNPTAPRPIKTAIQKVLFHRVSGWWPKQPEKSVTFKVPKRYENDTLQIVGELPDELIPTQEGNEEVGDNDAYIDENGKLEASFGEISHKENRENT